MRASDGLRSIELPIALPIIFAGLLAADPSVMLMDEPFGALDPIRRIGLQAEFLRILRGLKKTVVLVTHDIDEAIRMGTRIAIMRDGRLVQDDTPERILAAPADAFVEEFVGADRALKRLALLTVAGHVEGGAADDEAPTIALGASLRDALSLLLATGAAHARVVDERGATRGRLTVDRIKAAASTRDTSRPDRA